MKKISYFISIVVLCIACNASNPEQKSGFEVKGRITNYPEKVIRLFELTPKGLKLIDSSALQADGSFMFKGKVSEKTFTTIGVPNGAVVLIIDSNSHINISVDANAPDQYGVNGSPDSEILRKLLAVNNKYLVAAQGLEKKYAHFQQQYPTVAEQEQMRNEYDSIMAARTADLQSFTLANESSIVPYFTTNFLLPESDFEFFEKVDNMLFMKMSKSKYAQEHHKRVEVLRKTAVGQPAPDIVLPDPFGKTFSLSSFRGKVVLVDFWASWCRPCRAESPNLVRMYNKFKTKGFDIFSVSLDDNREYWQKAINDDKLLWTHVSDLRKWNSQVATEYRIDAIPFTVLVDKDGKILAKNLRGDQLEKKLDELFR